jgi:hypothetical protein
MTDTTSTLQRDVVTVYGIHAGEDTTRAPRYLEAAGLPHAYVRLDQDAAAKAGVAEAGYQATPVLVTPDGRVFVEPSDEDLSGIVASATGAPSGHPR